MFNINSFNNSFNNPISIFNYIKVICNISNFNIIYF